MSSIFAGEKCFEFRRRLFPRPVDVIVVYATAPVGQVVGEFDVKGIVSKSPTALWDSTHALGGIDKERFFAYFDGCEAAHAIEIGEVREYAEPLPIGAVFGLRPPQSFVYLGGE